MNLFMLNGGLLKRSCITFLVVCLLVALAPVGLIPVVKAASSDFEVKVGNASIGNISHPAENMLANMQSGDIPGFTYSKNRDFSIDFFNGDTFLWRGDSVTMTIDVASNPQLVALAEGGNAKVEFGWSYLEWRESCGGLFGCSDFQGTHGIITVIPDKYNPRPEDTVKIDEEAWHGGVGERSGEIDLKPNTTIQIYIEGVRERNDAPSGVRGLYVRFKDETRPVLNAYSFKGNGAENTNENTHNKELYVKENEFLELTYKFNKPVRPYNLAAPYTVTPYVDPFLRHPLFVNPDGTGLPAENEPQYLSNMTYTPTTLGDYKTAITYKYTGVKYHYSGNRPVTPKMSSTTSPTTMPIDKTLEEKLNMVALADAAGNVAVIDFTLPADANSNSYVKDNHAPNPFDAANAKKGYDVIIDAVAPKYTKTGNGIQPDILTGVTVNKNDRVEFTVQFTEEVKVKNGWDVTKTYLLFNNGMKAYYVSGEKTGTWKFGITLNDAKQLETPLLKVMELSHDNKGTDTEVLQDYAGNLLIQPANYDGIHIDGDASLLNSKIDWANLSIDNTPPTIQFHFEADGASDSIYRKNGKVTIDANDPNLLVPPLDSVSPNTYRPSKGIYRPSNLTGAASPSVGLVYYYWSSSPNDPFADKADGNFAAIKRYSLAAKQPWEDLYTGNPGNPNEVNPFEAVNLQVANNKTNMLGPPADALKPENSGIWYLHAWTADMTWDSARELMQYEKMKSFVQSNPSQYNTWKNELPNGSEQDRIFHANTKAMAAVGQYGDKTSWPITDYMWDDSNWTHAIKPMLLDNKPPTVVFEGNQDDRTRDVKVPVSISDEHSGLASARYQFVKVGEALTENAWKNMQLVAGKQTLSTLNKVDEDGQYELYIKAVDQAGNEIVASLKESSAITVDSSSKVKGGFTTAENPGYVRAHEVNFAIEGVTPKNNQLNYAITGSAGRPQSYLTVTNATYTPSVTGSTYGTYTFTIPPDPTKNGMQYVHVLVESSVDNNKYAYYKKYNFDNEVPVIAFNRTGSAYARTSQEVSASVTEPYSPLGMVVQYQWLRSADTAPGTSSPSWKAWPASGEVSIGNESLAEGETADFTLYVFARDGAGNETIAQSGPYKVSKPAKEKPPANGESNLIFVYSNGPGVYTAILELELATTDKSGYEYSVSADGGASWSRWKPYTNFVSLQVPTDKPELMNIQIKYRTPGKQVGQPLTLRSNALSNQEPVYAIASHSTTKAVKPAEGVDIAIAPALGIKVKPGVNPAEPERIGLTNTFRIRENGYYEFELTDAADNTRKDTLYVVVSNINSTPPTGEVMLLSTLPTNGNVSAKLINTSVPVRILNNGGRDVYTFAENGSFTFEFADEAGNIGTATATVTNIDKSAPRVRIVRSYQYGQSEAESFGTIRDGSGNVLLSSGVVLTVEKEDPTAKSFFVAGGQERVVLHENGEVSFVVSDLNGNTKQITEKVTNIVSTPPQPEQVVYTFVDENGNPLPKESIVTINGQQYAKGNLQAAITGKTTPDNIVFQGTTPVPTPDGGYTNRISGPDGTFELKRTFAGEGAATVAITDLIGNRNKIPLVVKGLDNTPPELTLNRSVVAVMQGKPDFNFRTDLGGFAVSDNVSQPERVDVAISGLDLNVIGRQRVTYTATDEVGNKTAAYQDVYVTKGEGMLIFANSIMVSSSLEEAALFDTNRLVFDIRGYNEMKVDGKDVINEAGEYEVLYYPGLFREGQMKYIASKLSYEQLTSQNFAVTFPQAGWYTIVVRNQEREREFSTIFVKKVEVPM